MSLRSDWGSGYCADVAVSNPTAQPVEWQVNLTVDGRIDNLWNAVYTQTGTTLTARGLDWNRLAPANGKVQFGFCAQR
ncbi:MAG: cellulose binding domain-containing protein [Candidatus Contendobacter sp.]|nr:cellulose binding domain-containing protein [Candidatus Contendobacter sp.]